VKLLWNILIRVLEITIDRVFVTLIMNICGGRNAIEIYHHEHRGYEESKQRGPHRMIEQNPIGILNANPIILSTNASFLDYLYLTLK
jgi:hypothetical protein